MTLGELATTFVVAVMLHNAEEALLLPRWSTTASRWYPPVGGWEFRFAVAVLSLVLVVVALLAVRHGPHSLSAYIFFGFVFAMAANAVVPHLGVTLALRQYMPGTATGLLLNLPLGIYLLHEALREHWVNAGKMIWVAPVVAIALVFSIPILLATGRYFAPASKLRV